ncbi:MAG: hypothetical protein IJ134_01925 [Bacilli bacterium]|nr:hypothetical protein [Bacilli bacterium]
MSNYNEISNYLFTKMILSSDNVKQMTKKFPSEFKYPIINLFNLDKYIDENELTKKQVKNAYILTQILIDNSKNDPTFIEYVNSLKIKLNLENKDELDFIKEELENHGLEYLRYESIEYIHLVLKYQSLFDYLFFNLLIKKIYEDNDAIYKFLKKNDIAGTDILISSINYYSSISDLTLIPNFKEGVLEVLNYNKSQISKSNTTFINKLKLKKITNKCISNLKN